MSTVNERQSSPGIKNRDSGPAKSEGKQPLSVMRFRKDRLSWTLGGRVDVSNGEGGKHVRRELRHTEGRSIKRLHWALPSVLLGGEYSLQHFTQTTETKTKDPISHPDSPSFVTMKITALALTLSLSALAASECLLKCPAGDVCVEDPKPRCAVPHG